MPWDGSFNRLRIRGTAGALLWGYREAATMRNWTIQKGGDGQWRLTATLARAEPYQLRQRPLLIDAKVTSARGSWWLEEAFRGH